MRPEPTSADTHRGRPLFGVLLGFTWILVGAYWCYTRDFNLGGTGHTYHFTGVPALEAGLLMALAGVLLCISFFSSRFPKILLCAWLAYVVLFLAFASQHYGTKL